MGEGYIAVATTHTSSIILDSERKGCEISTYAPSVSRGVLGCLEFIEGWIGLGERNIREK